MLLSMEQGEVYAGLLCNIAYIWIYMLSQKVQLKHYTYFF